MKILKNGNPNKCRKPERFVCDRCGCEYIAEKDEYKIPDNYASQHDGIKSECECPACGAMNYIYYDSFLEKMEKILGNDKK